ncbi:MAG: UDP-N-acetylmuramate--L-alanine ligase [Patescibacteria group bacterium]|nr:UDP-N-acetylmuramate--L-alanine ligase [Patescibacteria group bacterium]
MKIHFIGIGGIGVSALAKYYLEKGHNITGSDLGSTEITDWFEKRKVKIFIGKHKSENMADNINLVIYSPAVPESNPELEKAKRNGLKIMTYPQALGELSKKYFTIAITGTHGKSTTTAMIGLLLIEAGLDPTVIVGTKLKEFDNSSCRVGNSKYLVIEACEHFESFLNYYPNIIVLTTIEADHLDHYGNLQGVLNGFKKFIANLKEDGIIVANKDDENIHKIVEEADWYSLKDKEAVGMKDVLQIPGDFNVSNALAALKVARILKIKDIDSHKVLSRYKGSWRRFEITEILNPKPYTLIDDYAHHPTEINLTLKAAREKYPKKKIWCFFQPHQYQRTHYLFDDFIETFKNAPVDKLIITDIYDVVGREDEEIREEISSEKLVKAVNKDSVIYIAKEKIIEFLRQNLNGQEVIIIMGAGNIYDDVSLKLKGG